MHKTGNENQSLRKAPRAVNRGRGVMQFLADQMVKRMFAAGFPAKIAGLYRPPDKQLLLYMQGGPMVARPEASPHQYCEAVHIVHLSLERDVSHAFWQALAASAWSVSEQYEVPLDGQDHDPAHWEIRDWWAFKARHDAVIKKLRNAGDGDEWQMPSQFMLDERFRELVPSHAPRVSENAYPQFGVTA